MFKDLDLGKAAKDFVKPDQIMSTRKISNSPQTNKA
jgi:hypothetical protein